MKIFIKDSLIFILAIFLLVGCGTTSLQTKAKLTRTITLDKSDKTNKNIYVQVSNTAGSGGEDLKLYDNLKTKLEAKGYSLVQNSNEASYSLFVNVLFANNLKEANAIKGATSAGLLVGVGKALSGGTAKGSLIAGAIAALGGGIVGSAMEDQIFRAVIDVEIKDYMKNNLQTTRCFIEAVRMDLKLEEALPVLSSKASTQISNLF